MKSLWWVALMAALVSSVLTWLVAAWTFDPPPTPVRGLPGEALRPAASHPTSPSAPAGASRARDTALEDPELAALRRRVGVLEERLATLAGPREPVGSTTRALDPAHLDALIEEHLAERERREAEEAADREREEWRAEFERGLRLDLLKTREDLGLHFGEGEIEVLADIFTETEWRKRDLEQRYRDGDLDPHAAEQAIREVEQQRREQVIARFGRDFAARLFGE